VHHPIEAKYPEPTINQGRKLTLDSPSFLLAHQPIYYGRKRIRKSWQARNVHHELPKSVAPLQKAPVALWLGAVADGDTLHGDSIPFAEAHAPVLQF
jgi:hypothetical protein